MRENGRITANIKNQSIEELLEILHQQLGFDYFLLNPINFRVDIKAKDVHIDDLIYSVLHSKGLSYRKEDSLYYIGKDELPLLQETRRIFLESRSVDDVSQFIPSQLKAELEILEFDELNSLIISGPFPVVDRVDKYLNAVDVPVTMVIIEVIIVDYQRNAAISAGIEAGIGQQPGTSSGELWPSLNYALGAQTIKDKNKSFNGFGYLNM